MAITTNSELEAAIAEWAGRAGTLGSVTPDFVVLTEALFNHGDEELDFAPLRCRQMETSTSLTMSSGVATLPTDFLEVRRVTAATSPVRELTYASQDWLKEAYPDGQDSSAPSFYSIEADELVSVADVTLVYYAKIPDLATNSTNWLLTTAPNAYLFGGLFQYSIYQKDDNQAQRYLRMLRGAVKGLQRADMHARAGVFEKRASGLVW